ncbi:hypothetical protein SNOG_05227 [Parastagonospora nodorum SN15]|uniref:Uncharacterized protein n=1 Tax=Phaeosphaeria nodorum (strain SN15 / ATCC MYA-4574 / FGSC 10173) TaxID=321614 RepID=Q0USN7_PHANO|nr:hypothetical protein SNOG_05227 [Parastagonospora nodorum SN15]EAT87618.1 hypothetical protein SNOG_05227 [Parastagonospora nodorum SN15]
MVGCFMRKARTSGAYASTTICTPSPIVEAQSGLERGNGRRSFEVAYHALTPVVADAPQIFTFADFGLASSHGSPAVKSRFPCHHMGKWSKEEINIAKAHIL